MHEAVEQARPISCPVVVDWWWCGQDGRLSETGTGPQYTRKKRKEGNNWVSSNKPNVGGGRWNLFSILFPLQVLLRTACRVVGSRSRASDIFWQSIDNCDLGRTYIWRSYVCAVFVPDDNKPCNRAITECSVVSGPGAVGGPWWYLIMSRLHQLVG